MLTTRRFVWCQCMARVLPNLTKIDLPVQVDLIGHCLLSQIDEN